MDGFGDNILEVGLPRLADGLTMAIQNKFYKLLHVAYLYKETTGGKSLGGWRIKSFEIQAECEVEW